MISQKLTIPAPVEGTPSDLSDSLALAALLIVSRMQDLPFVGLTLSEGSAGSSRTASLEIDETKTLRGLRESLLLTEVVPRDCHLLDFSVRPFSQGPEGSSSEGLVFRRQDDRHVELTVVGGALLASATAAQDFLEKVSLLLELLASGRELPFREVALLTAVGRQVCADPAAPLPRRSFVPTPRVFLETADRYPDQPAVSDGHREYTYRTLQRTASFLAHRLIEAGLRPGDPVLVSGPSCFGTIAAFLAVGLAEGVLISLDGNLPDDRQHQIVELSRARFSIAAASGADQGYREWTPHQVVLPTWPTEGELVRFSADQPPAVVWQEDADAYVFFTSGSSGVPKGVLGWHQGLAHFLDWQRTSFPIGPGDRSAQITALSFDVVLRDIFYPLTSGACIVVPERSTIFDPRKILPWMAVNQITILHSVPSLMKAWLLAETGDRPLGSLRYVFFAGEPLADDLLRNFRAAAGPEVRITNLYGPTETTLAKLSNDVTDFEPGIQPIGLPQPGVDVLILRDRKVRCGLNEIGEIVIRTPYRSKGYFQNQALTDEFFVPNPWSEAPGDLLYCTGDLGKVRDDGKVLIYGRIDGQIKIRGVRIEPHEIETHILQFPGITDAVVTARVGSNQEKTIYAFVVLEDPVDEEEFNLKIRAFLKARLPEVMVPKRLVPLKEIPHLPNGKIDRRALATVEIVAGTGSVDLEAYDEAAAALVQAIEKNLGVQVDNLGLSFIDLGGDSLSFIRVGMVLEKYLGWLPVDWEKQPVGDLVALKRRKSRFSLSAVSSTILGRALGILNVLLGHFGLFALSGSTTALFLIAGISVGRYQLASALKSGRTESFWKTILFIALPATLLNLFAMVKQTQSIDLPWLLMINSYFSTTSVPGFWFINVLLQIYAIFALLLAVPAVRKFLRGRVFEVTFGAACVCLLFSAVEFLVQNGNPIRTPAQEMWLLLLGVALAYAETKPRKLLVALLILFSGFDEYLGSQFSLFPIVTGLFILVVPRLSLPKPLAWAVNTTAGASLFLYLTHMYFQRAANHFELFRNPWYWVAASLIGGVLLWKLWEAVFNPVFAKFAQGLRGKSAATAPLNPAEDS